MGKGSKNSIDEYPNETSKTLKTPSNTVSDDPSKKFYSWAEIKEHNKKNDCWIVLNGNVYNVTSFKNKHPGGSRIIMHYAGQDASVCTLKINSPIFVLK
jgi:cytochrome b involved in lipid metabolism